MHRPVLGYARRELISDGTILGGMGVVYGWWITVPPELSQFMIRHCQAAVGIGGT